MSTRVIRVCKQCFLDNPEHASTECHDHAGEGMCDVVWDEGERRYQEYRIRPLPKKDIKGRFILCSFDERCRGEQCSYAHSEAERKKWNDLLAGELVLLRQLYKYNLIVIMVRKFELREVGIQKE